jgi:hypothetical protein
LCGPDQEVSIEVGIGSVAGTFENQIGKRYGIAGIGIGHFPLDNSFLSYCGSRKKQASDKIDKANNPNPALAPHNGVFLN